MKKFVIGFVVGFLLASTMAYAVVLRGSGYLMGWDVKVGGETVCSDPYIWDGTQEIECD